MKHYIDGDGKIYAFQLDGSQDHLIEAGMSPISEAEVGGRVSPSAQDLMAKVRSDRNRMLAGTDYLVMPDYPQKPAGIEEYRQALRDITEQSGFPESVEWPER